MTDDATPREVGYSGGLGPLVGCPLCGADNGYLLAEGSTYRWWLAQCKHCGGTVAECASDCRTTAGTVLPDRWPAADRAWNDAGGYANSLRVEVERLRDCRTCAHHTYASGGCVSALRCVGGNRYQPTQPRQLWEARPTEPAPF